MNAQFAAEGYEIAGRAKVVARIEHDRILVWTGADDIFNLRKGETLDTYPLARYLAFQDVRDFLSSFKIRNKRAEVDEILGG